MDAITTLGVPYAGSQRFFLPMWLGFAEVAIQVATAARLGYFRSR